MSSDIMLDKAYAWVCSQRLERSHNNSIWDLRYNWHTIKPLLQQQLRTGQYFFSPLQSYYINKGFDFLGVHFGLLPTIAKASQGKHLAKLAQRYAQGASAACIGDYVARWTSWCTSVLRCVCATNPFNQSLVPPTNVSSGVHDLLKENTHGTQPIKYCGAGG